MIKRLRLWSGLVLLAYVVGHLLNLALGLISLQVLEAGREIFVLVWRNWPMTVLLVGALLIHMAAAVWSLYSRRKLRMSWWEAAQLAMGFAIPLLLFEHVVGTRILHELYGTVDSYTYTMLAFWVWSPDKALTQTILLLLAWIHGGVGLHYWLRLKPGYKAAAPYVLAALLLIPVLSWLGFYQAGKEVAVLATDKAWLDRTIAALRLPGKSQTAAALTAIFWLRIGAVTVVAGTFLARAVRLVNARRRGVVRLTYPGNRVVEALPGMTILEASRAAGIPHASVCGGRGRCSTCRVYVGEGRADLSPPTEDELKVLNRVSAPPNVRLACQLRPNKPLEITPLLPPSASPRDAFGRPTVLQGRDMEIAILFADLRAFTRFAESRLPYDVVFVLNRYFAAMGQAIADAGGHLDKFIGDGVMALFGVDTDAERGCRAAIEGARNMSQRLRELNETLESDLPEPLRMGIGIHAGPTIVGEMGYGQATSLTAVGDSVNTASRLEALTKKHRAQLVVSRRVERYAGVDLRSYPAAQVKIRGRKEPMQVRIIDDAGALPSLDALLAPQPSGNGRPRPQQMAPPAD